jgi:DNA-binding NtrC family response regulator
VSQAAELSRPLAVLRVHLPSGDVDERAPEVLVEQLKPTDVLAAYGPGEYEVLLIDTPGGDADDRRRKLEAALARAGLTARIGLARFPEDDRSPEGLVEHAHAEAHGLERDARGRAIVIQDRVMVRLHKLIERVAQGNISVLLLGETGVGKEVLAEAVHRASPRASGPYVKLNCAALTESLFESELFGHEKGAFTGALKTKPGLLETASGGTLFLDEVGEMPHTIQVKLLRVLEERRVMRVGGLEERALDVRFVAATNRNLEDEVARGRFRQDLYYRLNGIALVVPPLRERVSEIEGLARVFIQSASSGLGQRREPRLRADALDVLKSYGWPGNIRELRNVIERAVLLAGEDDLGPEHLPLEKMGGMVMSSRLFGAVPMPSRGVSILSNRPSYAPSGGVRGEGGSGRYVESPSGRYVESASGRFGDAGRFVRGDDARAHAADDDGDADFDLDDATMDRTSPLRPRGHGDETSSWEAERQRIIDALDRCAGNPSAAAKLLGMSRRTLVTRLVTHRIPRPRKPLPDE